MIYKRHYVQFNDLVFDDYDMVDESDTSVSFKSNTHDYTFRHGSYAPLKHKNMQAESGSVSLTLRLQMRKLPCDVRRFYPQFAVTQLTTAGKLWAVQNNTLIWAFAYITDYTSVVDAKKDELKVDVDFAIPEGVWHKADKQRTFLTPYDKCLFMDCYGYKDLSPCKSECCHCATTVPDCLCCDCYDVSKEMALCYFKDLQGYYDTCGSGYHIVYNCEAAQKFFGDLLDAEHFGQKFCNECAPISGLLYSDTEIPTNGIKITLHGAVNNPEIVINGNSNIIKGSYDGILEIYADGSVYYTEGCCPPVLQNVDKWVIPDGMSYGWEVHSGNNSLVIYTNSEKCCDLVCAYVEIDALTI